VVEELKYPHLVSATYEQRDGQCSKGAC
jgi:hypothetical protein